MKIGAWAVEHAALPVLLERDLDTMSAQMVAHRWVPLMCDVEERSFLLQDFARHLPAQWVGSADGLRHAERNLVFHNRMPAVLALEAWPAWLGEESADEPRLKSLLAPYPADDMICWPVSARVGNVRNNDSSLIEPVAAT